MKPWLEYAALCACIILSWLFFQKTFIINVSEVRGRGDLKILMVFRFKILSGRGISAHGNRSVVVMLDVIYNNCWDALKDFDTCWKINVPVAVSFIILSTSHLRNGNTAKVRTILVLGSVLNISPSAPQTRHTGFLEEIVFCRIPVLAVFYRPRSRIPPEWASSDINVNDMMRHNRFH